MKQSDTKFLVVQADDLGLATAFNEGIKEAYNNGFLTGATIRTNGLAFEHAINHVIPECPGLGVGIHLNIVEGYTQRKSFNKSSSTCNSRGRYTASFGSLLKAQVTGDKQTFTEVKDDFRRQIELVLARGIIPDHLSSHRHSHAVPRVFEIVCQLAAEYNVPFVRLIREKFYLGGNLRSHAGFWYPVNLLKHLVLKSLWNRDLSIANQLGVRTNDYFVGVTYTGHMNGTRIIEGLRAVSSIQSGIVEVLLHPCKAPPEQDNYFVAPYLRGYVSHSARAAELSALSNTEISQLIQDDGW